MFPIKSLAVANVFAFAAVVMSESSLELMQCLVSESLILDKLLFKMLNHLVKYSGKTILDTIHLYNSHLRNLTELVKADSDGAQPCLDNFLRTGNPKFLEVEHSDFQLKVWLRWKDDDVATFHSLCVRAYNHWADLMFLHHNFTTFI
ncbi:uncharacterized protein LOC124362045 isoform X2 [Homalodisca vitripennis]|nr:uncharacterized protein LOC124362045 isoform X2 [Homalodisca vitripennis]KAG8249147.1 hypothetical protein J6590_026070 [Homalodisca vitripennis]